MEISFSSFCEQVFSNPVLMITVLLTLGVIFVNGWTDAPNAIATCIATRCMKVRTAIMMSAVFNFLGVLVMTKINSAVASTISNMVDFGGETNEALIALCAAFCFEAPPSAHRAFGGASFFVALAVAALGVARFSCAAFPRSARRGPWAASACGRVWRFG